MTLVKVNGSLGLFMSFLYFCLPVLKRKRHWSVKLGHIFSKLNLFLIMNKDFHEIDLKFSLCDGIYKIPRLFPNQRKQAQLLG